MDPSSKSAFVEVKQPSIYPSMPCFHPGTNQSSKMESLFSSHYAPNHRFDFNQQTAMQTNHSYLPSYSNAAKSVNVMACNNTPLGVNPYVSNTTSHYPSIPNQLTNGVSVGNSNGGNNSSSSSLASNSANSQASTNNNNGSSHHHQQGIYS